MKKIITIISLLGYLLASNTLAHTFSMNKIDTVDAGCSFHAQMEHDDLHDSKTDPIETKECYESCLGGYDEASNSKIKITVTTRNDNLLKYFGTSRKQIPKSVSYAYENKGSNVSWGTANPRLIAKIIQKLE